MQPTQHPCLENPTDRGAWRRQSVGRTELDTTNVTARTRTVHSRCVCGGNTALCKVMLTWVLAAF